MLRSALALPFRLMALPGGGADPSRCPECHGPLTAPELNRVTRSLGRRCPVCREWQSLGERRRPDRAE
jgi:hypothetical protein